MEALVRSLKILCGIVASLGSIIPGYSFYTLYSPPLFKGITLITSALCLAFLVFALVQKNPANKQLVKKGLRLMLLSFVILIAYLLLFKYTTASYNENVIQAGFGRSEWSLTEGGKNVVKAGNCNIEDNETLLLCAGFSEKKVTKIWKYWTVISAGLLLIFMFVIASALWTYSWALLAKSI
ncbi:MAG: hypothetical protein JO072_16045 [Parafilimonas sp.]|nr:hypothetical protein [Parafilimonas sp.]